MIRLLDEALERMFRAEILDGGVNIEFETPNRAWSAGVSRPALNVFMWDLRRSAHEARAGKIMEDAPGGRGYKLAPPRIACRYHLTAWGENAKDEHRILSSALELLLPIRTFPDEYLAGSRLADTRPLPDFRVGTPHVKDFVDFWSALQGEVKGGIDLVATITMDSGDLDPAGKAIGGRSAKAVHREQPGWMATRAHERLSRGGRVAGKKAAGRIVTAPKDMTLVLDDGTFWITADPGDTITVDTVPPQAGIVPEDGPIHLS